LTTVRGWFPVGPQIVRSFPTARGIREAERLGVLVAWCERYLPRDPASAKDLGVRISRDG
jgi:hypothetical protein